MSHDFKGIKKPGKKKPNIAGFHSTFMDLILFFFQLITPSACSGLGIVTLWNFKTSVKEGPLFTGPKTDEKSDFLNYTVWRY